MTKHNTHDRYGRKVDYIVAILAAMMALLVRAAIDPLVTSDHFYVISLLAVVFVSWRSGFAPGVLALLISLLGMVYLFVEPRYSLFITGLPDILATSMFFICGLCCAGLGEAQRRSQRRSASVLQATLQSESDLKAQVTLRREAEATLRTFYDNSPIGMGLVEVLSDDILHLYDNEASARLFGGNTGRVAGRLASQLGTTPEDLKLWMEKYRESGRTGKPVRFEYELGEAGERRVLSITVSPLTDGTGSWRQFCYVAEDVTDRRRYEEAMKASEFRFRTLTEAIPQMVWTADAKGEITFFNSQWDKYTGLSATDSNRYEWAAMIHPEDVEQVRSQWQLAVAHQAAQYRDEFRLRRVSDGAYRWMLSLAVPLRNAAGAVTEWVGSTTDIEDQKQYTEHLERVVRERTALLANEVEERKQAELQVRAVAAELTRSNGELEQFAYIASHDLQEPLRKIQSFGDRLHTKFRDQLPEIGQDYIQRMLVSAGRMRRLIDDLLSYSRVTTQARAYVTIDLKKLIDEVVSDLEAQIEHVSGEVRVGAMPSIAGDPTQMRQLFQNLIANGLKFRRPEVPPVVEIRSESVVTILPTTGDVPVTAWRLTVRDNGIGFDEKYAERIFQVFQKLHGRDEYEGTGIGLAVCKKIVERHGGTIIANSTPDQGATFTITLPINQAETAGEL